MAHDFNNLLTVVVGHAHLVLQQLPPNDPLRGDLGAVLDAAARGATITRQLLTYAGRDVVHPVPVDPAQAIARWHAGCSGWPATRSALGSLSDPRSGR